MTVMQSLVRRRFPSFSATSLRYNQRTGHFIWGLSRKLYRPPKVLPSMSSSCDGTDNLELGSPKLSVSMLSPWVSDSSPSSPVSQLKAF